MPRQEVRDAVLKPAIDENLPPIVDVTLAQWIGIYDTLSRKPYLNERDVFALTGHYKDYEEEGEPTYRARLDDDSCRVTREVALTEICDIDSVLGIVRGHFPIQDDATMKYYMLHDSRYTFTSNVHLPPVLLRDGDMEEIHLHKLPNTRFASIGEFKVFIFLPELRHEHHRKEHNAAANYIGEHHLKCLYNKAVLPAAIEVVAIDVRRQWPAEYGNEMFRAAPDVGAAGGNLQESGREVHGVDVNNWIDAIRRNVDGNNELAFARGFFFLVEGKGFKYRAGIQHAPPEGPLANEDGHLYDAGDARTTAIQTLLADFTPHLFPPNTWFLDIATTVGAHRVSDHRPISLFVNHLYHPEIINHFTDIPVSVCENWVETHSGGYAKDEEAHLGDFAGFRLAPEDPEETRLHYLQVYTTNKSVTYHVKNKGNTKVRRTSPQGILANWEAQRTRHFIPLQNAFSSASATHSVAVRFESRVNFETYPYVHFLMPRRILAPWLFHLRNSLYWGFKYRRIMSIGNVLNRLCKSNALGSLTRGELPVVASLLIILAWMANALVNRPDDGGHWDEVRDAACIHGVFDGSVYPYRPLVIFYLHTLYLDSLLPRVSSNRTISSPTIIYLCSNSGDGRTELEVLRLFRGISKRTIKEKPVEDVWGALDVDKNAPVAGPRRGNKQHRVTRRPADDVDDVFSEVVPDTRMIVRYPSEELDPEVRDEGLPLSQQITNVVHAFPLQVFAKVPNRRGGNSWCTLDEDALYEINFNIFRDVQAPRRIFTSYVNCGRDPDKWQKTIETWLPTVEYKARLVTQKIQGLPQLAAWADWETLLMGCDARTANQVVQETRAYVSKHWSWLPWMTKRHLWSTGKGSGGKPVGTDDGGPWIIFNPKHGRS